MRRVFDRLLRYVVRWLRRHRYARMAGRIRELEIELGMREPTFTERYANPALIGNGCKPSRDELRERERLRASAAGYLIRAGAVPAVALEATGATGRQHATECPCPSCERGYRVKQHATDHARNFFVNGDTSPAFGGVVAYWTEQATTPTDPTARSSA